MEPFSYIFGEYVSRPDAQDLYSRDEGSSHPFTKLVRIKLISRMLRATKATATTASSEYELSLEYLKLGGVILDYYAVHDLAQLAQLREDWLSVCFVPWRQPFQDIKNYFGEKMGFYFYFVGTYASRLVSCLSLLKALHFMCELTS